jgi:hypothetical protein
MWVGSAFRCCDRSVDEVLRRTYLLAEFTNGFEITDGVTVGIPAPPAPEGVLRLVKLGILAEADTGNFAREQ